MLSAKRFLIDGDDLIAGLGHLMASFNIAMKVAARNNLELVAGQPQSLRAMATSQLKRLLFRARKWPELIEYDHQGRLHDKYRRFLSFSSAHRTTINALWRDINAGKLELVELPEPQNVTASVPDDRKYAEIDRLISSHPNPGIVFRLPSGRLSRCDSDYDSTRGQLRDLYLRARRRNSVPRLFDGRRISVAISIRRGDIVRNERFRHRLVPDSYYCNIIHSLTSALGPDNLQIIVFSDADSDGNYIDETGRIINWRSHPLLNPSLSICAHLDERRWLEAIDNMISADVLVTSRSGFSYLAAILSENTKIVGHTLPGQKYDNVARVIHAETTSGHFDIQLLNNHLRQPPLSTDKRLFEAV